MADFHDFQSPPDENPVLQLQLDQNWSDFEAFIGGGPPQRSDFDWRDQGLSFRVRDQDGWNACTAFALVAMVEARRKLRDRPDKQLMASHIHCCLAGIADPIRPLNPRAAGDLAASSGIACDHSESLPIPAGQCVQLAASRCSVPSGDYAPILGPNILNLLVSDGPMLVDMYVPADFSALGEHDVYEPTPEGEQKLHSMCLVGYHYGAGVAVVLNSMGSAWGNHGYANIRIGAGGLLDRFPYIVPVA